VFAKKREANRKQKKNESVAGGKLRLMSRPNIIVCAGQELFDSFFPSPQAKRLSKLFRWQLEEGRDRKKLNRTISTAQALITSWDSPRFSEELLESAPNLRIIAHCGGEVKSRFARPLFERLTITNAADPMARAAAEMGAAFLLYGARNIDSYRTALRGRSNRVYEELHLHGNQEALAGREVAMIGFGRIGRALIDLMRGFDLQWLVYDPYAPKAAAKEYPVRFVSLEKLLSRAELLVLTAALTDETRGLLNRKRLAQMPDGGLIVNIARGGLVDLDALTKEVKRGRLRCALDVTDPLEPLPVGHPIRNLPGAMVTPHIAASNRLVRQQMAAVIMDDLESFFAGHGVKNRVTPAMLDRMT
jgi:phosphoglycerate dehydrogenase-like enzyme